MTKAFVDDMIRGMKLANLVAKATPWSFEGYGDAQKSVRYVGLAIDGEWLDVFSQADNVLLKFVIDRNSAWLEYHLANKPPFIKIFSSRFDTFVKWEGLLGEFRRRLKRDKEDFVNHKDTVDNLYKKIKPALK